MGNKFILGTVQLGVGYGINNKIGKPSRKEAFNILDLAYENDIQTLDSADGYGEALKVIGSYFAETKRSFQIINKFKIDDEPLSAKVQKTLYQLQQKTLYCYMYHQFYDYSTGLVSDQLKKLKERGVIEKIGLSLYGVEELEQAIKDPDIEIIQLPVNILDLNVEKKKLLQKAKKLGKEIHARSIYLQGLFFKDPATLTGNLISMSVYLEKLRSLAEARQIDLKDVLLNFALQKEYIDFVVLGIEQASQLKDNLNSINPALDRMAFEGIEVHLKDRHLLNPANWRP